MMIGEFNERLDVDNNSLCSNSWWFRIFSGGYSLDCGVKMLNCVYILFKKVNENRDSSYFIVGVYENEEDAYSRKAQMFDSEKYFVEEWEIQ